MDMISNLPLELRIEIFKRFVLISKDMKTELQSKWFILFFKKARLLYEDCHYDQCIDTIRFLRDTVTESEIQLNHIQLFADNKDDLPSFYCLYCGYPYWLYMIRQYKLCSSQ